VSHHQADQHTHYGNSRRREREKGSERLFEEIVPEYFPNLMKDVNINIQEAQAALRRINQRDPY